MQIIRAGVSGRWLISVKHCSKDLSDQKVLVLVFCAEPFGPISYVIFI